MSWIPPDLSRFCQPHTTVTACLPPAIMYLQLITQLFNFSPDKKYLTYNFNDNDNMFTFTDDDNSFNSFTNFNWYRHKQPYTTNDIPIFDFIIIGAGSAGCVVARRLSEIQKWKILLLEAGIEEPAIADVPSFAAYIDESNLDWGYQTQPEAHACRAMPQGRCPVYRGKVMGGSSTINYMFYIRGNKKNFDQWEAMGNPGWSFDEVLYYFKKSEDNENPEIAENEYYHGQNGPQTVEWFPYEDENVKIFLDALYDSGYPRTDSNAEEQLGAMRLQMTSRDGLRLSTNGAFIRPIRQSRKNLRIETQAYVTRVLIDPATKNAFGVEYVQNGHVKYALAQKEIILSAGAINSPQILMVSGIGPRKELEALNIPVLVDLPVGKNLQDHATMSGLVFGLTNYSSTEVNQHEQIRDTYKFYHTHSGPLSATGTLQVNAFFRSKYAEDYSVPDIQYTFDVTNIQNFYTEPTMPNLSPLAYYNGVMLRPVLLRPRSTGEVQLNQSDPIFGSPLINRNFFTEYPDLDVLIDGINEGIRILESPVLKKVGTIIRIPLPACNQYRWGTRDYWQCVIMSYTATIYHPTCTNKMGPLNDPTTVVNHELRVHHIQRLRVIDSSIMPFITSGNTNGPTIMIAEKGSDLVKHYWLQ